MRKSGTLIGPRFVPSYGTSGVISFGVHANVDTTSIQIPSPEPIVKSTPPHPVRLYLNTSLDCLL